tara:strand:- start:2647 stop:2823 length:177 start_codon:yes stop_codon:yes gene_type:complete
MRKNKKDLDWKTKAVYYSQDNVLGNPIVTYYNNKLEVVNCERKDKVKDPKFLDGLKKK